VNVEQRVQLTEVVHDVVRIHSRNDRRSTTDDPLGAGCNCGFKRTSLYPPGNYASHLAAAVIDSLGITQDQWHSESAVRWDGITDYPTFRIAALECPA